MNISIPSRWRRNKTSSADETSWTQNFAHPVILWRRVLSVFSQWEKKIWLTAVIVWFSSGSIALGLVLSHHVTRVPASGGEYREGLVGSPQYLNPLFAPANPVDRDIAHLLFSGLVRLNPSTEGDRFIPDLAQRVDINTARKEYRITLKPNLRWHDNQPITADDIIFTVESIQNPEWKSPYAVSFKGVTAQKVNDRVVLFNLPEPFPPFIEALSVGILPKHIWGDISPTNARLTEYNIKPIGSGPFRFQKILKDKKGVVVSYTVEKNPNYYEAGPFLNRVTLKFYPQLDDAYNALQKGEIDGLGFLSQQFAQLPSDLNTRQMLKLRLPQYIALFFNLRRTGAPQELLVRQALTRSINKEQLVAQAIHTEGERIDGPILPGQPGFDDTRPPEQFNIENSQKTLDQAGWKRLNEQEYTAWKAALTAPKKPTTTAGKKVTTPTPPLAPPTAVVTPATNEPALPFHRVKAKRELELTITALDRADIHVVGESVQQLWGQLGIRVKIIYLPSDKLLHDAITPRQYDVLLTGQLYGTDPDPFPFWHSSQLRAPGLNYAQLSDKKIDDILTRARQNPNIQERAKLYKEFQSLITAQAPAIFLYSPYYTYVFPPSIVGNATKTIATPADRFSTIGQWYTNTRFGWK